MADDHANAALLAAGLDGLAGLRVRRPVETNIVLLDTTDSALSPLDLVGRLVGEGIRCLPLNATTVRLVTHLDVSRDDIAHAVAVARRVLTNSA
jgi:threonine aldolase